MFHKMKIQNASDHIELEEVVRRLLQSWRETDKAANEAYKETAERLAGVNEELSELMFMANEQMRELKM